MRVPWWKKRLTRCAWEGSADQIGGGFHRYSTDARWRVPHFEKMLYDQALLLMAYTEAWQVTGNPQFRATAEEIITYVIRDLTSTEGAFYSAEDADSEGGEGAFYLWTKEEACTNPGKRRCRTRCTIILDERCRKLSSRGGKNRAEYPLPDPVFRGTRRPQKYQTQSLNRGLHP